MIRVLLRGPQGKLLTIDAIIDTGFTGSLTLPLPMVHSLGLSQLAGSSAVLADGSSCSFGIYAVEMEWDGSTIELLVSAMGTDPLVGMRILSGHELRVGVRPGGAVDVKRLP